MSLATKEFLTNVVYRTFLLLVCVFGMPMLCFSIPFPEIPNWFKALIIFVFIFWGIPEFCKKFRCWKIHESPSAVFYLYWTIFFLPIVLCVFLNLFCAFKVANIYIILSFLFLIIGTVVHFLIPKQKIKKFNRFSSEAVGKDGDAFSIATSAENYAKGLMDLKKHVSVVSLDADTGYGKSSFVRMMIESLEPSEVLYTYISLTETNDSADFSYLFTERWLDTLNERYPRLINSPNPHFELLSDIARENKEYFLVGALIKWLKGIDFPLFQSPIAVTDPFINNKKGFNSDKVNRMFGGIPNLKEKKWIIVIDDFERSPVAEIYRVIEIIERFKVEGRNGLPVQIVFILCFAGSTLRDLLNKCEDDLAFLVEKFLLSDSTKAIDRSILLPPISRMVRKQFIINKSNKILSEI